MTTRQHYPNGIIKALRFRTTSNLKLDAADIIERLLTENQMLLNELKTRETVKRSTSAYTQGTKQTDTNAPERSEHRAQETTDATASVPEHKKQHQCKNEAQARKALQELSSKELEATLLLVVHALEWKLGVQLMRDVLTDQEMDDLHDKLRKELHPK